MKRYDILNAREAIKKLSETVGFPSGTLKMRKLLKPFREEIMDWEKAKNDMITKTGKKDENGNISIVPGTKEYKAYVDWSEKEQDQEVEIKTKPIPEEDLEVAMLSVNELESLIPLGLYKE